MDTVTVKRLELLIKLRENREAHAQLYKDAVEGYKVDTVKKLQKAITKVEAGQMMTSIKLSVPRDHTNQYDSVIAMLDMSVDEEIELRQREFDNYVRDEWINQEERHMLRAMALSSSNSAAYL